ncbi:MAG: hypothetical protein KAI24_12740 [Planctomycetes bacterium]|nr:hypothetical protein [Planctomycetota bacterium]
MPAPLRFRRRRHLRYLAIELLVVVLGVSISLLLNEWRQHRADRAEEQRMLDSFAADLRQDHDELRRRIEQIEVTNRLVQQVRAPEELAKLDEARRDRAMDALLGYLAFSPMRAPYLEMQQTGSSGLLRIWVGATAALPIAGALGGGAGCTLHDSAEFVGVDVAPSMTFTTSFAVPGG